MLLGDLDPGKVYQLVEIRVFAPTTPGEYPVELSVPTWRDFPRAILLLDHVSLTALGADPKAYGLALGKALFADEVLGHAYRESLAVAFGRNKGLRVRLRLDAPELQSVRWERIYHPLDGDWHPLAVIASTPFSRDVPVQVWEPPQLGTERPIQILVIIASPADLDRYHLDSIVSTERQLVHANLDALPNVTVTYLESGTSTPPTLNLLRQFLADGYHLVHFLCHGANTHNGTVLYLENKGGNVDPVKSSRLVNCFKGLAKPPLFCFLEACESAFRGQHDAFVPLGPTLVSDCGIQAVLAMSDLVGMETAQFFAAKFYTRLLQHGIVDVAVNEARALVEDEWDWSVPVLFMRLKQGLLFEVRNNGVNKSEITAIRELLLKAYQRFGKGGSIYQDECDPVIKSLTNLASIIRELSKDDTTLDFQTLLNYVNDQVDELISSLNAFRNVSPPSTVHREGSGYAHAREEIRVELKSLLDTLEQAAN